MVLPEVGREDLLHQVIGAIGLHLQLFQDDALFLFDVLVAKQRMQHQVGQHVEGARQVFVEDFGVEAHQLLAGEGVEVAADRIHRPRNVLRRAAVVPLNSMCSMKWEMPLRSAVSRREPVHTQTPTETDRTCRMRSLITRRPLASVVISISRIGFTDVDI